MASSKNDLIAALRSKTSDDQAAVAAFTVSATGKCTACILEIANGFITTTVEGGNGVDSLRFSLSSPNYSTVGRLADAFRAARGYDVITAPEMSQNHPSNDLQIDGLPDISNGQPGTLRHHIFSDEELSRFLMDSVTLHNPNYQIATLPVFEHPYVLMKAAAHVYRAMAADTVKRRGLAEDAQAMIALAQDMERQYRADTERQHRVIPQPKADESTMREGDAVQGVFSRRSGRAGYTSPYRAAIPPTPPDLFDCSDDDVEDTTVRLRFSQNREVNFSYYEIWRDTRQEVERSISGRLANAGASTPQLPVNTQYSRAATAKQVLGVSAGANRISPIFDGFFFWTAAELAGSNIVNATFIDGLIFNNPGSGLDSMLGEPLEPGTDYYYRVYGINWNGEVVPSRVIRVTTKGMRARFKRLVSGSAQNATLDPNAITPTTGPLAGGTAVVILGTGFTDGMELTLGGKLCTITSFTSTTLNILTPAFTNTDFIGSPLNFVLRSPNGLQDFVIRGFTYTA